MKVTFYRVPLGTILCVFEWWITWRYCREIRSSGAWRVVIVQIGPLILAKSYHHAGLKGKRSDR